MGLHPRATTLILLTCEQVSASSALKRAHVPILACGASSGASLSSGGAQNSFAYTCACVSRTSQSMNLCVEDDLPVLLHPSHRRTAQRDCFPDAPRTRSQAPSRILSPGTTTIQGPHGDDQRTACQCGRPGTPWPLGRRLDHRSHRTIRGRHARGTLDPVHAAALLAQRTYSR